MNHIIATAFIPTTLPTPWPGRAGEAGTTPPGPVRLATSAAPDHIGPSLPACRLRRVVEYIDEHREGPIRLTDLSALLHMSPFHFARLFTRTVGVSPHRFIVRRRIEAAQELLTTQGAPIAMIARSVGFRTPSHFATTFRRLIGMTPTAYRSGRLNSGSEQR